ncbi:MAG: S1 RNA-binding domain-containing protein [Bacteroidota bacterium]
MNPEIIVKVLEFLAKYGFTGFVFIVLIILVIKPENAEKLKALLLTPTFRLFKWGSKQYISSKIISYSSEFLSSQLKKYLPNLPEVKLKIKWVSTNSDSILKENNILILRLEETNDQTRNTLAATKLALPKLVLPTLRHNLQEYANSAIDLAILKKLSDKIGKRAFPIYQKYFLYPELEKNLKAAKLLNDLVTIDRKGIFVSIFLDELERYGEHLYRKAILEDRTDEIILFLDYLVKIADREIGVDVPLAHDSGDLRVSMLLLAKSLKAESKGVKPYLNRIQNYARRGYEVIYVYAYPSARDFLQRLIKSLEAEDNILIEKRVKVEMIDKGYYDSTHVGEIVKLSIVKLYETAILEEKLASINIKEGDRVQGTVIDVAKFTAIVDIQGINCFISRDDCSWEYVESCTELLCVDTKYDFIIQMIDKSSNRIYLSRRFPSENPFRSKSLPKVDQIIEVYVKGSWNNNYICHYLENIEIHVPFSEISWLPDDLLGNNLTGLKCKVKIMEVCEEKLLIKGSIKRTSLDQWYKLHKKYPVGTELIGKVVEINTEFVKLSLPDGLFGIIPKDYMIKGGFEYQDYHKNVVIGQGIEVVVSKVFIEKRKIRLDLKRNIGKKHN